MLPKAQIILMLQRSAVAETANRSRGSGRRVRGAWPRSTMRVPQPDIIEHFGNADAVPLPERSVLAARRELCGVALEVRKRREYKSVMILIRGASRTINS